MKRIKLFLTDCDGCLTDGGMYYTESGDEFKRFNAIDGMGFQCLRENGILTGIVTGERNEIVSRRAKKIRADFLLQGVDDKLAEVIKLCEQHDILLEEVAYVGDDINDLELIKNVGYGFAVNNSIESIKEKAKYVSPLNGGYGAVRDIIEWVLERND